MLLSKYGLTDKWAADVNLGGTTAGWRYFDNGGTKSRPGEGYLVGHSLSDFQRATANSPGFPHLPSRGWCAARHLQGRFRIRPRDSFGRHLNRITPAQPSAGRAWEYMQTAFSLESHDRQ